MKLVVALLIVLGFMQISRGYVLNSPTMDEILENLQGNNHNVYLIFFVDSTSKDQQVIIATKDVEEALHILLRTYPQVYFTKLDISHKDFKKFSEKVEVGNAPAALLMVHGKGLWVTGTNHKLFSERLGEFIPVFLDAARTHTDPY